MRALLYFTLLSVMPASSWAAEESPCNIFSKHLEQLPYLEQLIGYQHRFSWRGELFDGCRVMQQSSHYLLAEGFQPTELWPDDWQLQKRLVDEGHRQWLLSQGMHFCLLTLQQQPEWRLDVECALLPLNWPEGLLSLPQ